VPTTVTTSGLIPSLRNRWAIGLSNVVKVVRRSLFSMVLTAY
jgi:hypothetical protein